MVTCERATALLGAMNNKKGAHERNTRRPPGPRRAVTQGRQTVPARLLTKDRAREYCWEGRYSFGVNDFDGSFRFEFASGCVWEQTEYKYSYHSTMDAIVVDGGNGI